LTLTPDLSGTLLLYLASSYGGIMISLYDRMNRYETDADKVEFIRGVCNLLPEKKHKGFNKAALLIATGYVLSKKLPKNG